MEIRINKYFRTNIKQPIMREATELWTTKSSDVSLNILFSASNITRSAKGSLEQATFEFISCGRVKCSFYVRNKVGYKTIKRHLNRHEGEIVKTQPHTIRDFNDAIVSVSVVGAHDLWWTSIDDDERRHDWFAFISANHDTSIDVVCAPSGSTIPAFVFLFEMSLKLTSTSRKSKQ